MIREAINELKKYTLEKKNTETVKINVLHLNRVIKALEQTRWIPVTERLPESDEQYHTFLVTDRKGKVTLSEFYLSIKDKKPYWSGMIDVIAWMPLPEPYKAESEDNR